MSSISELVLPMDLLEPYVRVAADLPYALGRCENLIKLSITRPYGPNAVHDLGYGYSDGIETALSYSAADDRWLGVLTALLEPLYRNGFPARLSELTVSGSTRVIPIGRELKSRLYRTMCSWIDEDAGAVTLLHPSPPDLSLIHI